MKVWICTLVVFLLIGTSSVWAQQQELTLDVSFIPLFPQPQQQTIARVSTINGNINRAQITWRLNGEQIASGIGVTEVRFVAPAANTSAVLQVDALLDGARGSISETLIPGKIDLLWEAVDSYTPPFYRGKAIPTALAQIRVTAVPTTLAPRLLSFVWTRNGTVLQGQSGSSRNSITFKNTELVTTETISVQVDGGQFQGEQRLSITPTTPSIIIYPKSEGFINYNQGANSVLSIIQSSIFLRIEPYFFSVTSQQLANNLRFQYRFNNEEFVPEGVPNEVEISNPGDGRTTFRINIESIREVLQHAQRTVTLFFSSPS